MSRAPFPAVLVPVALAVFLSGLLGGLLGAHASPAPAAEVSDPARAILEKAIASMGGDEALAGVTGFRLEARGTWRGSGMAMPYTSTAVYLRPGRMVWRVEGAEFKGAMGAFGDTVWGQMMQPPARLKGSPKQQMRAWLFSYELTLLRPLLHADGLKVTGGEPETVEGKAVHRVRVEVPWGDVYTLTFPSVPEGEKTFLVRLEGPAFTADGRQARMTATFAEPRTFGPITLPAVSESSTSAGDEVVESMQEETTAVEWNPTVPDDAFAVPDAGIPLDQPSRKTVPAATVLAAVHAGPHEEMSKTIQSVMAAASKNALVVTGPVIAVYRNSPEEVKDPAELRTDLLLPVVLMGPPPEALPEGVTLREEPAADVAAMAVRGPYGKADVAAFERLAAWVKEQGLEIAGPCRTLYFHDPGVTVEEDQISEVQYPVRKP